MTQDGRATDRDDRPGAGRLLRPLVGVVAAVALVACNAGPPGPIALFPGMSPSDRPAPAPVVADERPAVPAAPAPVVVTSNEAGKVDRLPLPTPAEPPRTAPVAVPPTGEPVTAYAPATDLGPVLDDTFDTVSLPATARRGRITLRGTRFMPAPTSAAGANAAEPGALSILQIGDSHTAADFLTNQVRRRLQTQYGDGGPGYLTAGRPHAGVRSSVMRVEASAGWTYRALQRGAQPSQFSLAGFAATASREGERLTFTAESPLTYDILEVELVRQPGGGSIEVRVDDELVVSSYSLGAARPEAVILRQEANQPARMSRIVITTVGAGTVQISSVSARNRRHGVTVSSVGYPGATVDIVNRLPQNQFTAAVRRLDPQIVVLAFGTNEGFNDALDLTEYETSFRNAVRRVRTAVPNASIVVMAPPVAHRLSNQCRAQQASATCRGEGETAAAPAPATTAPSCEWRTPPKLDAVREVQRRVADSEGLVFWNWADLMPRVCGAQQWASATLRLMAADRVHFTTEGYRRTGDEFTRALAPVIERFKVRRNAVSHH
jgi:lysophospholipase L1-like esterase